jgi:brefeldin A-inhibited guanine nucleotide-exchange protein
LQTRIEESNQQKNNIERGIILFNEKPKKGLDFLGKHNLIKSDDPDEIAEFLLTTPGLSKFTIGQFIGHHDPFNRTVLQAYSYKFNLKDLEIDEALRLFLQQFRLPGESQMIDRIMESFSATYFKDNTNDFDVSEDLRGGGLDGVYVLAYSLIFLNTLNHNPKIAASRRLTKEQFVYQGRLSNPQFPPQRLEEIFTRVMENEFKTDT